MTLPKLPFPRREIKLKSFIETLTLYYYSGSANYIDSVFSLLSHWNWLYSDIKSLSLRKFLLTQWCFFLLLIITNHMNIIVLCNMHNPLKQFNNNKNINFYPQLSNIVFSRSPKFLTSSIHLQSHKFLCHVAFLHSNNLHNNVYLPIYIFQIP